MELEHAPDDSIDWHESHRLDAVLPAAAVAITLMTTKYPHRGHATFHGLLLRLDADPLAVVEFEVPLPSRGWEIRASGLWAELVCETPMEHWSYGLEAFGLAVDNPEELMGAAVGRREPLGWELEFEARASAQHTSAQSYGQAGSVHGVVLEAAGSTEVDGYGVRSHWWGSETPLTIGLGGQPVAEPSLVYPAIGGVWSVTLDENGMASTFVPSE